NCKHWIKSGSDRRGNNSTHNSDNRRHAQSKNNVLNRKSDLHRTHGHKSDKIHQKQSGQPTDQTQEYRFKEELKQDKVVFCPERFLKTDNARAFLNGNKHNVGNSESPNEHCKTTNKPSRHTYAVK